MGFHMFECAHTTPYLLQGQFFTRETSRPLASKGGDKETRPCLLLSPLLQTLVWGRWGSGGYPIEGGGMFLPLPPL